MRRCVICATVMVDEGPLIDTDPERAHMYSCPEGHPDVLARPAPAWTPEDGDQA